jgi:dihydroorotate dehydrogenase
LYPLIRFLLFRFDPERAHRLTFRLLRMIYRVPPLRALFRACYRKSTPSLSVELLGLRLANPVGLAAGLDKHAQYLDVLADCGFGWLELGTVTPQPQVGSEPPRLFRLPRVRALINRMGFNSVGLEAFLANLRKFKKPCPIGINIGKNRDTPIERADDDYIRALQAVYTSADYVAVNISSPNTPGLRALQENTQLGNLLAILKQEQATLARTRGIYVPIAVKIAPDLDDEQIAEIARLIEQHKLDAVIATNTTIARPGLDNELLAKEAGGLSGRPLKNRSTEVTRALYRSLQGRVPIIAVGGIESADDVWEKMVAGADAVQVYTAFVYEGPTLIKRILRGLERRVAVSGARTLRAAVEKARSGVYLMR